MDGDYRIMLIGLYHTFAQDFERMLKYVLLISYQKIYEDDKNVTYIFSGLTRVDAGNLLRHITSSFDSVDFKEIRIL